jgi:NTE family protein
MNSSVRTNPGKTIPLWRLVVVLIFAIIFLRTVTAQEKGNFTNVFPENDPLRLIAEPIWIGMDRFDAKMNAIRDAGREPLGLVLTGGSARAYAHIGVLEVLEKAGIVPDFIVADSMGAVVGMLYAAGLPPIDIADLVTQIPPETYLSVVLPTHGGFINTDAFVAAVKMMVGDMDLSDTMIPIIVVGEDLKSRRQVQFASGNFSKIMAMTFAMPAVFEPVALDDYLLVDGGSTNIIPVGIAKKYTGRIIVSTTLYDKKTPFGNPINVINRAFDIGKTRTGMIDLENSGAFVIRNRVEQISYMQFDGPEAIMRSGENSAKEALPSILAGLGLKTSSEPAIDGAGGVVDGAGTKGVGSSSGLPSNLIEARRAVTTRYLIAKRLLRDGVLPSVRPSLRYKIKLKLAPDFEKTALGMDAMKYIGAGLVAAQGRTREYFSALYMLGNGTGPAWAMTAGVLLNPVDTFKIGLDMGIFSEYSTPSSFPVRPSRLEADLSVQWTRRVGSFRVFPKGMIEFTVPTDFSNLVWHADAGGTISFSLRKHGDPFSPPEDSVAGVSTLWLAGFVDSATGSLRFGPELDLKMGIRKTGIGAAHVRASGRFDLSGQGLAVENSDDFRGNSPPGFSTFISVVNAEVVWHARMLEFDAGESIVVKNIEVGPYFDLLWGGGTKSGGVSPGPVPSAIAGGLTLSFTTSLIGLAPFDVSIFGGIGGDLSPVFGMRVGRLFPVF